TTTGASPAADARFTVRRRRVSPSSFSSILFKPIREEVPAASTTPATGPRLSACMDGSLLLAQVPGLARRSDGKQLCQDAHGDLLGSFGAEVETYRTEDAIRSGHLAVAEYLLLARARPQKADVGDAGRQQMPDPLPVVGQRVHLHDDVGARAEG